MEFLKRRHFTTASLLRNIGIIAHIDAGKTTTTEKLIHKTGLTKRAGSVDNGDTVMDYLPEERERGITITSAAITLPWRGHRLNLIDTPGHVDFTVEVERSLRVMDAAVVILDASKGVQAQTLTVWRQAQRYGLKSLVFINKMDKAGADLDKCLKDIRRNFGLEPILLNAPVKENDEFKGTRLIAGTEGLYESVAQYDDQFLEKYLEDDAAIESLECQRAIARITADGKAAIAVLVGASARDIGTFELLDAIVDYLPPPKIEAESAGSKDFKALAFKVVFDPQRNGFLVYCRVYSGEFSSKRKPTLFNLNQKRREQVGKVMQVMADEMIEIEAAKVGQVVILTGLKHTATGDTLSDSEDPLNVLDGIAIPSPVISVSLEADSPGVQDHLDRCLETLQLEDPSLRVTSDKATGQTVLSGMGELHLEIAVGSRLRKGMKAQFTTGPIAIAYLESLEFSDGEIMKRSHVVDRDIFGIKMSGSVDLEIKQSDSFAIESSVNDETARKSLEDGVYGALGRGPIGGNAVERNFRVIIKNLESETTNSAHVVVFEALQLLLKDAQASKKLILKEPLVQLEIDSPEQFIGDLTTDMFSQRRCVECETLAGPEDGGPTVRIRARAPLKEMLGYSSWLRSRTGGMVSFTMEACGYTAASTK